MSLKQLINIFIPIKKKKEISFIIQVASGKFPGFLEWAFGEDYQSISLSNTTKEWNKRHADLMYVRDDDDTEISLRKMVGFWKENIDTKLLN